METSGGSEIGVMRQLTTLNRIARIAIQDLALRPMLQRIVDTLFEEFGWEFLACASVDQRNGVFVCEAVRSNVATEVVVGYQRALGSGVVGECAQSGRTIDVDDARTYPGVIDTLHGARAELCVPVVHDGEVLAVLNAESRQVGAFRGQRELLETVADQVAGVIRAARLLDELQRSNALLREAFDQVELLSRTDVLTGLANRRCFDLWLEQSLAAAAKDSGPVSLLMIDVDHFKPFNDGYGHPAGDNCLQQVATLCAYLLAGTSAKLARYGGEEFAVILPGTDLLAAAALGERLRIAVEARELEHRFAECGRVTISVGVAVSAPMATREPAALIASADAALYAAKHAGRNRIRLANR